MTRGRPKKEEKRKHVVKVRLTKEEYKILRWASETYNQAPSDILRGRIEWLKSYYYLSKFTKEL